MFVINSDRQSCHEHRKPFIIITFLHGLGRLTSSGIDALPSFPRASKISSSSRFVVESVFRKSGVVYSFKMVDPVLFVFGSHVLYSRDLQFFSYNFASLLILSSLVYPLTLLRKRISAASRRVMPRVAVTHVSLPYSSVGLATTLQNFIWVSLRGFFKCFLIVPHILWNLSIFFVKV